MKQIIAYPGRFQPMMKHHVEIFHRLESEFPDGDVYMCTSNNSNPLSFDEKKYIATYLGIPEDRIKEVSDPFDVNEYTKHFDSSKALIVAIDQSQVHNFNIGTSQDDTGTFLGKDNNPTYMQPMEVYHNNKLPMSNRGYVAVIPDTRVDPYYANQKNFVQALKNAPDVDAAKETYTDFYGQFNQEVFTLLYHKFTGAMVTEEINRMRALAGLMEDNDWVVYSSETVFAADRDGAEKEIEMDFSYNTKTGEIKLLSKPEDFFDVDAYYDEGDIINQIRAEIGDEGMEETRRPLAGAPVDVGPEEALETGFNDPIQKLDLTSVRSDFGVTEEDIGPTGEKGILELKPGIID